MFHDLWTYNKKAVVVVVAVLAALLAAVTLLVTAHGSTKPAAAPSPAVGASSPGRVGGSLPSGPASVTPAPTMVIPSTASPEDAASLDALPPAPPARLSSLFPAVAAGSLDSPASYTAAWVKILFTIDYRHATVSELAGWVQYESAPLRGVKGVTAAEEAKVLLDTLQDPSVGSIGPDPIIPADGTWAAMHATSAVQTVADIRVVNDQAWEQLVASGYRPHDPLMSIKDVSATLDLTQHLGSKTVHTRTEIALSVVLGTAAHHSGYGVQSAGRFVTKQMSP